jgi:hypothetical protein
MLTTAYPTAPLLPQSEDMPAELAQEAVEVITAAVDKFLSTDNYEVRWPGVGRL